MRAHAFALLLPAFGCAASSRTRDVPSSRKQEAPTAVAIAAPRGPSLPREVAELREAFTTERVSGTVALFDTEDGVLSCSDIERCSRAAVPASTFKIANSLIALELGLVEGPDTVLKWDGKAYRIDDWNRDLNLRDAFRLSCVPCYQQIARTVGEQRMQEWVKKLDYGNHDTSGGIDRFWLTGGLRISPLQQIAFLRRLEESQLPVSERSADIVREIMTVDVTEAYVLRAKTGLIAPPEHPTELGWFVGYLELGDRRVFFATLLDGHEPGVQLAPARRRVTERILRARELM